MTSIKKRFLIGMVSGALIFVGGLGIYKLIDSGALDNIRQISAIKQMIQQAGEIAKTSNKDVDKFPISNVQLSALNA